VNEVKRGDQTENRNILGMDILIPYIEYPHLVTPKDFVTPSVSKYKMF
jgi:hypothetical protein